MIVVTFKGSPAPISGRARDLNVVSDSPGPSVADAIVHATNRFKNEREGFLFVAPGGRIYPVRASATLLRKDFDIAAFVDCIGDLPKVPGIFSGIGRVFLESLVFRVTDAGRRVLARWVSRNAVRPGNEAVELAIAIVETQVKFLQLPRVWIWRESECRALQPLAEPVIEFGHHVHPVSVDAKQVSAKSTQEPRDPEVLYSSHLRDYSGYAKASRNILFRISNSIQVRVDQSDVSRESVLVDVDTNRRIEAYTQALISDRAPLFRFYTPKQETRKAHRLCMTMMETQTLSPKFARLLNENYNEVLVPTVWNKDVFTNGGVRIPISVVSLGYDPLVYAPGVKVERQQALLLTTSKAGAVEKPTGYTFVIVFQPTFRKGIDHLVSAFERAFSGRPDDASLVLVTSVHSKLDQYGCAPFSRLRRASSRSARSKIYHLTGTWTEWEMARLYRSFDCYVASSSGEGWDLPLCEAAACGLPVIATKCSSHPELLDGTSAWMYPPDGYDVVPGSDQVSTFYDGQKFATFGSDAVERLSELLRQAYGALRSSRDRIVRIDHTWDKTAAAISRKIIKVNRL